MIQSNSNRNKFVNFILFSVSLCFISLVNCDRVLKQVKRSRTRTKIGEFSFGSCVIRGLYTTDIDSFNSFTDEARYGHKEEWTERCRTCSCTSFGAFCDGPTCPITYDFSQENWCIRWSADGCCCEQLGCTVDNTTYTLMERFPYGRGNPCLTCECAIGVSRDNCLRQECGTYEITCEGRTVTYDDNCCPRYSCPNGGSCTDIPDPIPETDVHELDRFFLGLDPIPIGTTQHFHIDSWNTYVCTCPSGGTAECKMKTYKH